MENVKNEYVSKSDPSNAEYWIAHSGIELWQWSICIPPCLQNAFFSLEHPPTF